MQNETGLRNLNQLVTIGYLNGFYYKPRIDKNLINKFNEGLICSSGCLAGEVNYYASIDDYENITKDVANQLLKDEMGGVYITAATPASILSKEIEVELSEFYFVDMISQNIGGSTSDPRTSYIESPTMLESVILNLDLVMRRLRTKKNFMILDSINNLSIHSNNKILEEFIHVVINKMKLKEVSCILFTVKEQTPDELTNILKLLSDTFVGGE